MSPSKNQTPTTNKQASLSARILAIASAALLLTGPALLNRYPLLYPDSVGYLQDGRPTAAALFLHRLSGYTAQRSELYSLGIFPFHWNLTPWPIVALNALLTAYVLYLSIRSIVSQNTLRTFLGVTAFLSLFTSVSWYVSLIMPDILGALLYLAVYLLVFARETLSRGHRTALSLIALWGITAHATHLMLAAGICTLLALLWLFQNRVPRVSYLRRGFPPISTIGLIHITALVAIATTAQIALHAYLYGQPSLNGRHPPYLMARIVADGPGAEYLRRHCPTPPPPAQAWAICAEVHNLPDNDDDFLWDPNGIWSSADKPAQQRLLAEEMPLVLATIRAYPGRQIAVSWSNFLHQLNDFGVNDFDNNTWMEQAIEGPLPGSHPAYARSLQARSIVPTTAFTILQRWIVFASALLLATLLPGLVRRRAQTASARLLGLSAIILPTLLANALVTAVMSSSDSRYQARVIWLLPLTSILALFGFRQSRA